MTSWRIAWRLVQAQGLQQTVTATVLALGLGLMLATVAVGDAARQAVSVTAERFPLVVGPRVGAIPLVLGGLTGLQSLDAAIDASAWERLLDDPLVAEAVPLLTGHAVGGHPLLGTSPERLQPRDRYPLADGRVFEAGADEVVLGTRAAVGLGLGVGDAVEVEHQHPGAPAEAGRLRVVGVLGPTGTDADDTLFCPLEAIHRTHAHAGADPDEGAPEEHAHHGEPERPVSAVLVRPVSPAALLALQDSLQEAPGLEVALSGQTLRRLADRLAGGGQLVRLLAGGVVLVTFLSLLMSLYASALGQGREIAVLRVLGASRARVLAITGAATALVLAAGTGGGLALAFALGRMAERALRQELGLDATVALLGGGAAVYLGASLAVLVLVGLQPALAAYHVQVAEALAEAPGSGRTTRAYLRWSLRFVVPLAVFVWAEQAMSRHGTEGVTLPLDGASAAVFADAAGWVSGPAPAGLTALDGRASAVRGYMYALGDPWEASEFYLVAQNPRLPRCPFCYRAPTRHERILVRARDPVEVAPGLVEVRGTLRLHPGGRDQVAIDLDTLTVVLDR